MTNLCLHKKNRISWDPYGFPEEEVSNIEIYGFKIDAGLFQEEPSGNRYNTLIHFTYPNNISIHDMNFANGQWDAIRLTSQDTIHINSTTYNNLIEKCGHDAISFVGVIGLDASVSVYPNPSSSEQTLSFNLENSADLQIGLYDLRGRLIVNVFDGNMRSGNTKINVSVKGIQAGVYFYTVILNDKTKQIKTIIQ